MAASSWGKPAMSGQQPISSTHADIEKMSTEHVGIGGEQLLPPGTGAGGGDGGEGGG